MNNHDKADFQPKISQVLEERVPSRSALKSFRIRTHKRSGTNSPFVDSALSPSSIYPEMGVLRNDMRKPIDVLDRIFEAGKGKRDSDEDDDSWTTASKSGEKSLFSFEGVSIGGDDCKSATLSWSVCSGQLSGSTWDEFSSTKETPSMWAISYDQLVTLKKEAEDFFGPAFSDVTMRDVTRELVVPLCESTGMSYAIYHNPRGLRVDAFISHCWDERFGNFVDSIRKVFQTCLRKPSLWICAFALPQGNIELTKELVGTEDPCIENSPFVLALQAANKFVVVRNSEKDLYTRIWCVCELLFAHKLGFLPDDTFITGPNSFSDLKTSCIDAQATNIDDKAKILRYLLQEHEYKEIDSIVDKFRSQDTPE